MKFGLKIKFKFQFSIWSLKFKDYFNKFLLSSSK